MLSRRSTLSLTALLAGTRLGLAWAKAQFWEVKPPADWSENEIKELMTKSPWAKQVTAEFKGGGGPSMGGMGGGGGGGGRRGGGGGGGGGMGGGGGLGGGGGDMGGGGGGGGMGGGGMPSMPQIKAMIRWETAAPIIQAGQRKWPASVAGHYLISVTGLPMPGAGGGRGGRGPQQPQQFQASQAPPPQMDPQQRARLAVERLKESSHLDRKGKDPIAPAQIEIGQARDGSSVLMFLFPKGSQPIEAADKEVTFITAMGPLGVKAKFALKDMMVKAQLEL